MNRDNKWPCPCRPNQLAVCALAVLLCTLPGCGGCRWFGDPIQGKDSKLTEEEKKKRAEEQKEKPDFEPIKVASLPDDSRATLKPGHWTSVRSMVALSTTTLPSV